MEIILNNKLEKLNEVIGYLETISGRLLESALDSSTKELFTNLMTQMYEKRDTLVQEFEDIIKKKYKYKRPHHP